MRSSRCHPRALDPGIWMPRAREAAGLTDPGGCCRRGRLGRTPQLTRRAFPRRSIYDFRNIDKVDDIGRTALHYASRNGHYPVVEVSWRRALIGRWTLRSGPRTPLSEGQGKTLTFRSPRATLAAARPIASDLQLLLDNGAMPNSRTFTTGATPLHLAAKHGYERICTLLMENGASREERDVDGRTPLDIAKQSEKGSAIKALE